MAKADLENVLRELVDKEAIRDLARRYAHCVWQGDAAGAVGLFVEDGEMDTGDRPPIRGRGRMLAVYEKMIGRSDFQPFVHNHVIELQGDEATGTCYLDLRATVDGKSMIGAGVYHDRYVRTSEGWRFRSRKLRLRYLVPLQEGWATPNGEGEG